MNIIRDIAETTVLASIGGILGALIFQIPFFIRDWVRIRRWRKTP